jgi:hypothetical protein
MINFFGAAALTGVALKLEQLGNKNDFTAAEQVFPAFLQDVEQFQAELDRRGAPA